MSFYIILESLDKIISYTLNKDNVSCGLSLSNTSNVGSENLEYVFWGCKWFSFGQHIFSLSSGIEQTRCSSFNSLSCLFSIGLEKVGSCNPVFQQFKSLQRLEIEPVPINLEPFLLIFFSNATQSKGNFHFDSPYLADKGIPWLHYSWPHWITVWLSWSQT